MRRNVILSFSLSGHGFSCAICINGEIVAASSLERITRIKNDLLLPITKSDLKAFGWNGDPKMYEENLDLPFDLDMDVSSIDFENNPAFVSFLDHMLAAGKISLEDVDCVVYSYRYVDEAREFFAKRQPSIEFVVPEHHFSHACQAFLPSPFKEAAIMIVDGQGVPMERTQGDQLAGVLGYGKGNDIEIYDELPVRHSLGGMYAEFTHRIGFSTNQEGKTMGLAPYGTDKFYTELRTQLKTDVSEFNLRNIKGLIQRRFKPQNVNYSLPDYGAFLDRFERRKKGEELTQVHKDLAFAVQKLTEDVMVQLADVLYERTGSKNLVIAGGVGLNCVANYQVRIRSKFDNIWVHPNPGDNGLAVGQALYAYIVQGGFSRRYVETHDYLGMEYTSERFETAVHELDGRDDLLITKFDDLEALYDAMASNIAEGKVTSWCQGRSEFGPRALGNRSILADPRRADMKDILNSRVKFRESFRPFTPSVLAERSAEFFELDEECPFMLMAPYVREGKAQLIPAITHADNTARVQTVTADTNERYYGLIKAFDRLTGIPMVLDTSFNIADEPIVESPEDAIRCFLSTDIDVLGIDMFLITKLHKTHKS